MQQKVSEQDEIFKEGLQPKYSALVLPKWVSMQVSAMQGEAMVWTLFSFFWMTIRLSTSVRVVDFDAARFAEPGSPKSSAILTNVPEKELPQRFILCFSSKQGKIDSRYPFVLYGEDDQPWLAFFLTGGETANLWVDIHKGTFVNLQDVPKPWTHVWMQVCADIDTVTGMLGVSLNGGKTVSINIEELKAGKPNYLAAKIVLGLSDTNLPSVFDTQFFGSVANLNIFNQNGGKSVDEMSRSPCDQGDFMNWSDIELDISEKANVIFTDSPCNGPRKAYTMVLPFMASWYRGDHLCKSMGNGKMTEIASVEKLNLTIAFVRETKGWCTRLWLPISDTEEEGLFRNTNTRVVESFLPWGPRQPNGQLIENHVSLTLDEMDYRDYLGSERLCVSCELNSGTLLRLRGLCKTSAIGKRKISKNLYLYIWQTQRDYFIHTVPPPLPRAPQSDYLDYPR